MYARTQGGGQENLAQGTDSSYLNYQEKKTQYKSMILLIISKISSNKINPLPHR